MNRAVKLLLPLGLSILLLGQQSFAKDFGIEGQVFEPLEEDMRIRMMRLLARQDMDVYRSEMAESAANYTKNLPSYFLPRATTTKTVWKDVGVVTTEDIYFPWVEWETGSVFEPTSKLAVSKGTYINPIAKLPASGIERLFVFDGTDPEQLALVKRLMRENIPQLSFMQTAGDLGALAKEMSRPVYHPIPEMLERFRITAVPSLVGFGRGPHQGHMAVTEFKLPMATQDVQRAWFGLPYPGYDPQMLADTRQDAPADAGLDAVQVLTTTVSQDAQVGAGEAGR